jgi:3-hydroxyacyl-[acyl-carrier-protein] dehydratase
MPPPFLFDISGIDLDAVVADQTAIRAINPQRGDMEHLNGINYFTKEGRILGYKDVKSDEFWVAGHIPGRPLLPGVIMVEAAAQLASFYVKAVLGWDGFIGFGGVDHCKFRQPVLPGCRLYLLGLQLTTRHRRFCSRFQGMVDGQIVFEADIVGAIIPGNS